MSDKNHQQPTTHAWHRSQRMHSLYDWCVWSLLVVLLLTQPLGLAWRSHSTSQHLLYGRAPNQGLFQVLGDNDEPYTDRAIVCSLKGRIYKPEQLSTELRQAPASSISSSTTEIDATVNGYRVIHREGLVFAPAARDHYANTCDQIATNMDGLLAVCTTLGYNVTTSDYLRLVVDNSSIVPLPSTLPVLILPFWDNALASRYVVPSDDGSGCMFRLAGKFDDATAVGDHSYLRGVSRSVRDAKTREWLKSPSGTWSHGWYKDHASGTLWHADMISTDPQSSDGIAQRHFDATTAQETNCSSSGATCGIPATTQWWSQDQYMVENATWFQAISISNGKRFGLFLYEDQRTRQARSVYRLENLLSNLSMVLLVFRWMAAMLAMRHSREQLQHQQASSHQATMTIGAGGALSCARTFLLLPIILSPRLKTIVTVFFTAGCQFEGEQMVLSETWFVVYPAIAEFVLLFYSGLNLLAKLLRRRMSDALFGPTLVVLSGLHYFRGAIASSGWLEVDGRVTTVVTSAEFASAKVLDVLCTDMAFRLNGKIVSLFVCKLTLLALHVVPLVFFSDSTSGRAGAMGSLAEKSLALRVARSGGLGRCRQMFHAVTVAVAPPQSQAQLQPQAQSIVPLGATTTATKRKLTRQPSQHHAPIVYAMAPYEVVRAGYVVLGKDALVSMRDWSWFMASAPFRKCRVPMRHLRMVTLTIKQEEGGVWSVGDRPQMCRVTDNRFKDVGAWEISLRPLR